MRTGFVYTLAVSKRLVDIDDNLLERARRAAGTPTIKATVEAGLLRLVDAELTERLLREQTNDPGLTLA